MHHAIRRALVYVPNLGVWAKPARRNIMALSRTYNVCCSPVTLDRSNLTDSAFQDAIDALNTLQTPYAVIEARRKAGIRPDEQSIKEMRAYLARIGYSVWTWEMPLM